MHVNREERTKYKEEKRGGKEV